MLAMTAKIVVRVEDIVQDPKGSSLSKIFIFLKPEMKQRIFSHFQDYMIQYISHQYQDLLYYLSRVKLA
jgi:hypothetical protein